MSVTLQKILYTAEHVCHDDARELVARAHERCPYSNATRGNIDVLLMVDGQRI
jgi:organic hydroperoxide reductase OsmC/OhrA